MSRLGDRESPSVAEQPCSRRRFVLRDGRFCGTMRTGSVECTSTGESSSSPRLSARVRDDGAVSRARMPEE